MPLEFQSVHLGVCGELATYPRRPVFYYNGLFNIMFKLLFLFPRRLNEGPEIWPT
jgi:hypothetical protein